MGGLIQVPIKGRRLTDNLDTTNEPVSVEQRAEGVGRNPLNQQLEEVQQQREVTQEQVEAKPLDNQQRTLEQTGSVDDGGGGGTAKPYNPTSSTSTTVEGLGGERDLRRKRNQLTAYLGI